MALYITSSRPSLLARVLATLVAALVLAGAFMLGLVVFAVAIGLGLLLWLGVWLRLAWMRRTLDPSTIGKTAPGHEAHTEQQVINAEYTVVSRRREP